MMFSQKPKRKSKTPIVYRPNKLFRFGMGYTVSLLMVFYILISFVALLNNFSTLSPFSIAFGAVIVFFMAQAAWKFFQMAQFNRLELWESGIEVYMDGVHSFIKWEDLQRFGWRTEGKVTGWGVYASRIEQQASGFFARKSIWGEETNFIPLDSLVMNIPRVGLLDRRVDKDRFMKTKLGQDLHYYAPHLFIEEKAKPQDNNVSFYEATGYLEEEVEAWLNESPQPDVSRLVEHTDTSDTHTVNEDEAQAKTDE